MSAPPLTARVRELFVYYRVRAEHADAARAQVLRLQQALRDDIAGLEARLLFRSDASAGTETWMETYALHHGGIDVRTRSLIAARAEALAPFIDGTRHVESFVVCSTNEGARGDMTD